MRSQGPYFYLVLILVFVALIGWGLATINFTRFQNLATSVETTQLDLQSALLERSDLYLDNQELQNRIAEYDQQILDISTSYSKLEVENQERLDRINDLSSRNRQLSTRIAEYEKIVDCDYQDRDFVLTNNTELSNQLKNFLGDIEGAVDHAEWEVLWDNSKTTLHRLTVTNNNMNYVFVFIAYYDEPDLHHRAGLFWVDMTCWLHTE